MSTAALNGTAPRGAVSRVGRPRALDARGPLPDPSTISGHVSMAGRVLQRVGTAVVAETLKVDRSDVHVTADDDAGHLAFRVTTPVRIPVLGDAMSMPEGGVVAIVRSLQDTVSQRVREITGRTVSRVDVTISGSSIQRTGRVS